MAYASYIKILSDAASSLRPPPRLKVSEWADTNAFLSPEDSALPGKWNTANAEFQRGIMDAFNESSEEIVCMTSTQIGKTSILRNVMGYICDIDPRPSMMVQPTISMAEAFSKDRFEPYIRDTKKLRDKFKSNKTKDSGNTILHKKFPGGSITFSGAESPSSLASRPISVLLLDEVDRWPLSVGNEGDPLELVIRRTSNFWNRKILIFSTPTNQYSKIYLRYQQTDRRKYFVTCPHCKKKILLLFPNLKYDIENDRPVNIHYTCPECGGRIEEKNKNSLIRGGEWIATAPGARKIGFWINALYSPWISWYEIIETFRAAKKSKETLRVFINTFLAEIFEDIGDAPDHLHVYARREFYPIGVIPVPHVIFLTAAVDVQDDRFEVEVKGWTRNHENYSIEHLVYIRNTSDLDSYKILDELLNRKYNHPTGAQLNVKGLAIDTGGHNTQTVYMWARRQDPSRVFAIKGATLDISIGLPKGVDINFGGQKISNGIRYWPVGVSHIKSELYARLRMKPAEGGKFPFGYCHYPDYEEEYFRQLTAESLKMHVVKGVYKYSWSKHYERNEALDLNVYNRAVTLIFGMDRLTTEEWDKLEQMVVTYNAINQAHTGRPAQKPKRIMRSGDRFDDL